MRRLVGGIFIGLTVILLAESAVERQRARLDRVVLRELEVSAMPLAELLEEELPRLIRRDAQPGEEVQLVYLTSKVQSAKNVCVTFHLTQVRLAEFLQLLCWQYRLRLRITPNAVVLMDSALGVGENLQVDYPVHSGSWESRRTRRRMKHFADPTTSDK